MTRPHWPPGTKEQEKIRKQKAKEEKEHKARVKAHHKLLAKKGSQARWPF